MSGGVMSQHVLARPTLDDVTVVVPARNAAAILPGCLASVVNTGVHEVVVVDGVSSDETREIAESFGARVISDEGRGLPAARMLGVEAATTPWVLLLDADVVLHDGSVDALLTEYFQDGYLALQAGLLSTAGPGYWGQALTFHHRTGRSRNWFGVVATVVERETLLRHGFDPSFLSGEDIDLRWRLRRLGKIGVSQRTVVEHRFERDDFDFARGQFLMDGTGLGRMVRKLGWRAVHLLVLPLLAGGRGALISLRRGRPRWLPYFAAFTAYNYVGIVRGLSAR